MQSYLRSRAWQGTLIRHATLFVVALLIGAVIQQIAWSLVLALLIMVVWHLVNLYRLQRWIGSRRRREPPDGYGIWSEFYDALYQRQLESRRRKHALLESLREFRSGTFALPDGVVVLDASSEIVWFNPAATQLLGLERRKDIGQPFTGLVRSPMVKSWLAGFVDAPEGILIEGPVKRGRTLRLRAFTYARGQRLLIARDVTQMQRVEAMRKDFVANVSHELRTPLTVISGYVEAMADESDATWSPIIKRVEEQTTRMRALVEDLLTLSQLDASHALDEDVVVSVPSLVRDVVQVAESLSEGRHQITARCDESIWLRGSPRDLRSVFINLASNAVRYTPDGGRIELQWELDPDGGHPVFAVTDNGPGIAPQHVSRLTERFYRVANDRSRATGGTGLGLAIVKNILALHDGQLKIESKLGHGSRFSCHFTGERLVLNQNQGRTAVRDKLSD